MHDSATFHTEWSVMCETPVATVIHFCVREAGGGGHEGRADSFPFVSSGFSGEKKSVHWP